MRNKRWAFWAVLLLVFFALMAGGCGGGGSGNSADNGGDKPGSNTSDPEAMVKYNEIVKDFFSCSQ